MDRKYKKNIIPLAPSAGRVKALKKISLNKVSTDFFTMLLAYPSISSSLQAVPVRSWVLPVVIATTLVAIVAAKAACKQLMVTATILSSRPRVIGSSTGSEKTRQTTEISFKTDCRLPK